MSTQPIVGADHALDPQLADLITEALVWSADSVRRAEVLARIVGCAIDSLSWRLQPDGDADEEQSAQQVLRAAELHLSRMRSTT
ncbi:MAG TPA: hypothetical protein VFU98_19220 [Microlunatus sp.]|nr:hypothetical protein [Microlunatus sp.]